MIDMVDLHSDEAFECSFCGVLLRVLFEAETGRDLVGNVYDAQLIEADD